MATFPWEYRATNGPGCEPQGFSKFLILIGLGDETPSDFDVESESFMNENVYIVRIDPNASNVPSDNEGQIRTDWADVLRLPTDGPHSQDHPLIRASRRHKTTWVGNVKLFPTVYDLITAASFHSDGSEYYLAERNVVVSEQSEQREQRERSGGYKIIPRANQYHPMSGKLPTSLTDAERPKVLSIILGTIWLALVLEKCGHSSMQIRIYRNLYSAFSAHTTPVVLLISYFGLILSGDGTVQDKLDRSAEYRNELAIYAMDVLRSYMLETNTANAFDCALKVAEYCGVTIEPLT